MGKKLPEAGCPLWMMSFGDCMSLLVTFFVMLIAFTNVDEGKLMDVVSAMKGALGAAQEVRLNAPPPRSDGPNRIRGMAATARWLTIKELSIIIPDAEMAVKRFGKPTVGSTEPMVTVAMLDEGLSFVVYSTPLFKAGTAEILPEGNELWSQIGRFVASFSNEVRVVGVVSAESEIRGEDYRTPLGLGIERASAVKRSLLAAGGLTPDRFSIGGRESRGADERPGRDALPANRMEVIVVGRRAYQSLAAEKVILKESW